MDIHLLMDQYKFTKNKHDRNHSCLKKAIFSAIFGLSDFYVNLLFINQAVLVSSSLDLRGWLDCALSELPVDAWERSCLQADADSRPVGLEADSTGTQPAVIVLDPVGIAKPVELVRHWHGRWPAAPILLLIETDDIDAVDAWLRIGVRGLLPRDASAETLRKAITTVAKGELWLRRTLMDRLLTRVLEPASPSGKPAVTAGVDQLSRRETEIVNAAAEGLSNREIATRLGIGESTVKTHLHHAFEKLNLVRRSQLLSRAPSAGY